jgi:hypothetical protein
LPDGKILNDIKMWASQIFYSHAFGLLPKVCYISHLASQIFGKHFFLSNFNFHKFYLPNLWYDELGYKQISRA